MKISRIISAVVFWLLSIAIMLVIFDFSSDTGEESKEISESILSVIIAHIGEIISHNFLRKLAHFTEYAALGFCIFGALHFTFNVKKIYIPLIPCVIYAVCDEIHQYFVPERACRVFDIFIDSCGSAVGILIFLLFLYLFMRHKTTEKTAKSNIVNAD